MHKMHESKPYKESGLPLCIVRELVSELTNWGEKLERRGRIA